MAGTPPTCARSIRTPYYQSRAKAPSEEESRGQLPKIFVQQLDLIRMPFEDKLEPQATI